MFYIVLRAICMDPITPFIHARGPSCMAQCIFGIDLVLQHIVPPWQMCFWKKHTTMLHWRQSKADWFQSSDEFCKERITLPKLTAEASEQNDAWKLEDDLFLSGLGKFIYSTLKCQISTNIIDFLSDFNTREKKNILVNLGNFTVFSGCEQKNIFKK